MDKRSIGKMGENIAEKFLSLSGIEIIKRNYFSKFGEIDLIGIEKKTIIFIEVKYRKSNNYGFPYEFVDNKKIEKIKKTAETFLIEFEKEYKDYDCRFDVISMVPNGIEHDFDIEWLKNQYFY
jgi:putative endonuclease